MSDRTSGAGLPADYERRLSNGALVLFGPNMQATLAGLESAGYLRDSLAVCSEHARDLALPRTLMVFAVLVFSHRIPDPGKPTTQDAARWKDRLLLNLSFAEGEEPRPAAKFIHDVQSQDADLQLTWAPPSEGGWNGVWSTQVKRVAVALDEAYAREISA